MSKLGTKKKYLKVAGSNPARPAVVWKVQARDTSLSEETLSLVVYFSGPLF
jgi:hypothetical protein